MCVISAPGLVIGCLGITSFNVGEAGAFSGAAGGACVLRGCSATAPVPVEAGSRLREVRRWVGGVLGRVGFVLDERAELFTLLEAALESGCCRK